MESACKQALVYCGTNKGEAKLKLLPVTPFVPSVFAFACATMHEGLLTGYPSINQSVNRLNSKDPILHANSMEFFT